MKKLLKLLITFSFLFVGCTKKNSTLDRGSQEYISYYKAIEENDVFNEDSNYYSINAELVDNGNGKYTYYIFIDDPKIAMYDIKVLAIEDGVSLSENQNMQASIGIFENSKYSMVPFQVNVESGYYKGLMLSGETNDSSKVFKLLVNWYGIDRKTSYREFISFTLDLNGIQRSHDDIEG